MFEQNRALKLKNENNTDIESVPDNENISDTENFPDTELIIDSNAVEVLPLNDDDHDEDEDDVQTELEISEKALVVPNALQRYLSELRKYPLISREEERATALKAFENDDLQARQKLVTSNLRLVVKIAMDYRSTNTPIMDLIQEGNAGLVQAVNRFNPYREVKLSTYSAWWIRAYILKFLMDNKSLVRMGTTDAQRRLFFKLRSEAQQLYARTQKFDTKLLAERIGVEQQDVIEMEQRLSKNDLSLDTPVGETDANGNGMRRMDQLSDSHDNPEVTYEKKQLLDILQTKVGDLAKYLNERDLFILSNRILADTPITLQEIGDKYGVTRERARQLETIVLKKIREKLRPYFKL